MKITGITAHHILAIFAGIALLIGMAAFGWPKQIAMPKRVHVEVER